MPEIRPITDFYDPTKAFDTATRYLQGQQHLALQNQQLQQQQANQEIDNLRQGAQLAITENPPGAAPAYNRYAKAIGAPEVTDSNAFAANPKPFWDQLNFPPDSEEWKKASATIDNMGVTTRKRSEAEFNRQGMLQGSGELLAAAGLPATAGAKSLLTQSEQGQREVFQAVADPSKQAVAAMNKQIMAEQAGINAELRPLLDMNIDAGNAAEELAKITPDITRIQAQYEKEKPSKGITAAAGARRDALLTNPDLAAYMERSTQSVPQIEQALSQVKQQLSETTKDAHHSLAGTKPQTTDDSLHTSVGSMNALKLQKQYLESALALAKDPTNPAKHAAMNQVVKTMDARAGELYQQRTALDVRRDAQQEAARKNLAAEQLVQRTSQGEALLLKAVRGGENMDDAAARIGQQLNVSPADLKKALASPDKPLARVDIDLDKGIAKEVGPIVSASHAAALGAIDTVDTVQRANAAIAKGMVNVGPTATIRQTIGQVAQLLGVGGKGNEEQLVNTRNVIRSLGQFSLAARKQLKGQGQVSDFEGKLLIKAESGEIEDMTIPELKSFLKVTDRLARKQYDLHQQHLKRMKANPNLAEVAPFYEVPDLPSGIPQATETPTAPSTMTPNVPHISSDAEYRALPPGTTYIAPDGSTRKKK